MIWIFPLVLLIVFETIADVFSKTYALRGSNVFWALALVGYIIANIFWLQAIRNGSGLARGGTIFSIATEIFVVILGIYFYKEKMTSLQSLGVALGVISVILIVWE